MSLRNGYLKVADAAEAGREKGGEMTWMRTRGPGSRWRRKETHGGTWGRPLPSSGTVRANIINKYVFGQCKLL